MSAAGAILSDAAPPVGVDQAAEILRDLYGLEGDITSLPSERDDNFRVRVRGDADVVLKITHPAEPRDVTNFQTMALRHIAAVDPALAVPAVLAARDGRLEVEVPVAGGARIVRLLTYLPGQLLIQAPRSAVQDAALGAFLARLGRALRGFFHPAAGANDILWDLRQLPRIKAFVPEIADQGRRALAAAAIADAENDALPVLPTLRAQVLHNDMNPSNVVVDPDRPATVAGILDFGDMLHGPLICDVAVGASYRWSDGEAPLAGILDFVRAYHSVTPLEEAELAVLLDLIRARLALTVTLVNWQVTRFPEKQAYLMRMNAELWAFLEALSRIPRTLGQDALMIATRGVRR